MGVAWDPGRLSLLGTLELPVADERLKSLAAGAVLLIENDAVGVEAGYLPGLGERTGRLAAFAPPASLPRVVTGHPEARPTRRSLRPSPCQYRTGSTRCRLNIWARCSSRAGDTASFTS